MNGIETMLHSSSHTMKGRPSMDDDERAALLAESEMFPTGPVCGKALPENDRSCALRRRHRDGCRPASALGEAHRP